jgi:hypothetical protein
MFRYGLFLVLVFSLILTFIREFNTIFRITKMFILNFVLIALTLIIFENTEFFEMLMNL